MKVNGRDRNDVDNDDMLDATINVLKWKKRSYLKRLLSPLQDGQSDKAQNDANNNSSWLLKPASFFNDIIRKEKDFVLHVLLGYPKNSIFISNKTVKGEKADFFKCAKSFLKKMANLSFR